MATQNGIRQKITDQIVEALKDGTKLPPWKKPWRTEANQRRIVLHGRSRSGPQSIPLADFTLLLSTTDEFCLLQPLRDRMRLVLRFEFYSAEDLTTPLHQRSRALGWPIHEALLPLIAQRSRGTPRLALRLL